MSMSMSLRRAVRCALFATTVSATAAMLPLTANAADDGIQEVIVTGSRIAR